MKKVCFLYIAVAMALTTAVVLLCAYSPADSAIRPDNSIAPPSDIYVGMPRDDFFALYPAGFDYSEGTCFEIWGEYAFLKDSDGNPVIVYFERGNTSETINDWHVASVNAYDKNTISVSENSANQLKRGMTYQEIVSILGCPVPQTQSTVGLDYRVGDYTYHLECFGKTGFYDKEYVLGYVCIISPDGTCSYPMGTEPWEYVDPE